MRTTAFVLASLLCVVSGCDETGGSTTETTETTENVRASDPDLPDVTVDEEDLDDYELFDFRDLELPYETSEACIAHLESELDDTSSLSTCRCESCLEVMQECDALPGCVEIRSCSQNSGCRNEFSCYLLPGAACTETIDKWGNASVATATAVALLECTVANKCN